MRLFLRSTGTDLERGSERRMERRNTLVCAESNMSQDESFLRKQYLLRSYFGLSSTEELKNDLVNYQHTSTSLTIHCAANVNRQFWFLAECVAYV